MGRKGPVAHSSEEHPAAKMDGATGASSLRRYVPMAMAICMGVVLALVLFKLVQSKDLLS